MEQQRGEICRSVKTMVLPSSTSSTFAIKLPSSSSHTQFSWRIVCLALIDGNCLPFSTWSRCNDGDADSYSVRVKDGEAEEVDGEGEYK